MAPREKTIPNLADELVALYHDLLAQGKKIDAEVNRLEKAGCFAGSVHWQEKRPGYKVAYFNHSSRNGTGERYREYLGQDKDRIAQAEAANARYRKREVLRGDLARIDGALVKLRVGMVELAREVRDHATGQRSAW